MVSPFVENQTRRPALDAGLGFRFAPNVREKSLGPHQVRADEGEIASGA
jgi:hypothetical protein